MCKTKITFEETMRSVAIEQRCWSSTADLQKSTVWFKPVFSKRDKKQTMRNPAKLV
jgi:hypothetical protein